MGHSSMDSQAYLPGRAFPLPRTGGRLRAAECRLSLIYWRLPFSRVQDL